MAASRRDDLHSAYWSTLRADNPKAAITLEGANSQSDVEFHVYGVRIAERILGRMERMAPRPFAWSSIIDIGCGVGRFALPMACRFQHVYAVDISADIIEQAKAHCRSAPNISYHVNDGETLKDFPGASIDYAFCGGVLQHIKYFDVIASYFREALRVLRDGGLFAATFQVWQTEDVGSGRLGAKVTAKKLNAALADEPYAIRFLQIDPQDPVPHCFVILEKTARADARDFAAFPVDKGPFRTGVFEDLASCAAMALKWKETPRPVTFFDAG
ncbi:MAG: class I SAM-dependent methyltransferase [Parvularculaceae bacterium]|nr:class I SAM-dependent methyltransferase [Parvularculaceae bacterium]